MQNIPEVYGRRVSRWAVERETQNFSEFSDAGGRWEVAYRNGPFNPTILWNRYNIIA